MSGSGISWAICKSAARSRQITTPAPTTQFFTGRMPFLPPNQQRQSTEGALKSAKSESLKRTSRDICNINFCITYIQRTSTVIWQPSAWHHCHINTSTQTLNFAMARPTAYLLPQNCPFLWRNLGPTQCTVPWPHESIPQTVSDLLGHIRTDCYWHRDRSDIFDISTDSSISKMDHTRNCDVGIKRRVTKPTHRPIVR